MIPHTPPHNYTAQFDGFYISYNPVDVGENMYGDVTTALVTNDMAHFYILNGNHMEAYRDIGEDGFEECLNYFIANAQAMNKHSDPVDAKIVIAENGSASYRKGTWGYVDGEYTFTLEQDDG